MPAEALLGLVAQKAGNIKQTIGQVLTTADNRRYNKKIYNQQKADALEFWHMQNAYDSPQAQMARYEAAGLNPRLIYGQQNTGGHVQVPDFKAAPSLAPKLGEGEGAAAAMAMNQMYDLEIKKQQVNNMKAQYDVIQEQAALTAAQQRAVLAGVARKDFDLNFDAEMRETSADVRREQLRQLRTQIDISMNRDVREALMNTSNLNEALERIATMKINRAKTREEIVQIRETVENIKKEGSLKDLEIELRRMGLGQGDPWYSRIAGRYFSEIFDGNSIDRTSRNLFDKVGDFISKPYYLNFDKFKK